jgi:uncharacterized membrane protein YagU involved in acid resistance
VSNSNVSFGGVLRAVVAGALATAPMTVAMELAFRGLPRYARYPLPPRLITDEVDAVAGRVLPRDEGSHLAATLVAHFGYGAVAGGGFALVPVRGVVRSMVCGVGYGLALWAASYAGWLPAVRLMPSLDEQPRERTALMVGAHVVWGACLGLLVRMLPR